MKEEAAIELSVMLALDDDDGPEQHFLDLARAFSALDAADRKIALRRVREVIRRLQYFHTPYLEYGNALLKKFGRPPVRQETETILSNPKNLARHLRLLSGESIDEVMSGDIFSQIARRAAAE